MRILLTFIALVCSALCLQATIKVVTFHPILTDIAQQIGNEHISITSLLKPGADPHQYRPTPSDLKSLSTANLVLLMGKGLEHSTELIKTNTPPQAVILEVGRNVPSIELTETKNIFYCCPKHSLGAIDPHWWHSIKRVQTATRIIHKALSNLIPEQENNLKENANIYHKKLDNLYRWARKEVARIPRSHRKLATAHAAFGYFCSEFRFKAIPVQGLNKEQNATPGYLKEVIETIKKQKVPAVFPEHNANPKILKSILNETNITLGKPLLASGPLPESPRYEDMVRHNINNIVEALATK